jgi:hypothetical protein
VPKLSKKVKHEMGFYIDPTTGRRRYHDLCRKCQKQCKQSYRSIIIECIRYIPKPRVKKVRKSEIKEDMAGDNSGNAGICPSK